MAIQVNGTTVIDNSRVLQNVTGLKTIGGTSILGSGDISAGGGIASPVAFTSNTSGSFYASQSTNDWNSITIPSGATFFLVRAVPGTQSQRGTRTVKINIPGLSEFTLASNGSGPDNRAGIPVLWYFDIATGSYASLNTGGAASRRTSAITSITIGAKRTYNSRFNNTGSYAFYFG